MMVRAENNHIFWIVMFALRVWNNMMVLDDGSPTDDAPKIRLLTQLSTNSSRWPTWSVVATHILTSKRPINSFVVI